jgi:hypothetical protein
LCEGQFRLFSKQISANFAMDASQNCVAAADFMAKVDITSIFGAFWYPHQASDGPISIKLYDKFSLILHIETTVNNVTFFK